jgi:hypothetical protein
MNWFYIILYLLIGFASIFYGLKILRTYMYVQCWTKVKARVITKAVLPKRLTKSSRRPMRVSIEYIYDMNALTYKSDKVFLVELLNGERGFTSSAGEKFLQTVPDEIVVFVNPAKPEQSVMFADGLWLYLFMIVFGCMVFCVGLVKLLLI